MDLADTFLRALAAGAILGALYLVLSLTVKLWRWFRDRAVQDVGRAAGSLAGFTAKNSRKLSESFKDGFKEHS